MKVGEVVSAVFRVVRVHIVDQKLGGVDEGAALPLECLSEVGLCGAGCSLVGELALDHEEQAVELTEDITVRLVDGHYYGLVISPGQQAQVVHDDEGSQRVESGGGLIEHDHLGIANQLEGDGSPLPLAAGNTLDEWATYEHIQAVLQLQIVDQLFNYCFLFVLWGLDSQVCGKSKGLPNS